MAELEAAKGQGKGDGRPGNGEGIGDGSKRGENDSVATDFKTEQEKMQLTAGKMLMQWKTHGPSETGVAKEDYLKSVADVRQGVSEALVHEKVPPAYHDSVKKYFDAIDSEAPAPATAP